MPRSRNEEAQPILDRNDEDNNGDDNELGDIEYTCCNPRKSYYRFIALIFMCLVGFGEFNDPLCRIKVYWILFNIFISGCCALKVKTHILYKICLIN